MDEELDTTARVIEALGGISAVADLTGSKYSAAANWKSFNAFPSKTYVLMMGELKRHGKRAPASLWKMAEPVS